MARPKQFREWLGVWLAFTTLLLGTSLLRAFHAHLTIGEDLLGTPSWDDLLWAPIIAAAATAIWWAVAELRHWEAPAPLGIPDDEDEDEASDTA